MIRYVAIGFFAIHSVFAIAAGSQDLDSPVTATFRVGVGDHVMRCETLAPEQAASLHRAHGKAQAYPLQDPALNRASLANSTPGSADPMAGLVPADYINPVEHVKSVGHLLHEVTVGVSSNSQNVSLEEVFEFEAPDWARFLLVEFVPSQAQPAQAKSGLYLRPDRPFVGGTFPNESLQSTGLLPSDLMPVQRLAYQQASYRSEVLRSGSEWNRAVQYVLITRDMDPAPAGRRWHVALGQLQETANLAGTLNVWASGSSYRTPLAIQFFYDQAEQNNLVGFFDSTPRVPDGDNPGTTYGEALRWILFRATEELLSDLPFDGFLPIRIMATTTDNNEMAGVASSNAGLGRIDVDRAPPGRLRGRANGHRYAFFKDSVPLPVWEREAGTDACRAIPGESFIGVCTNEFSQVNPAEYGSTEGWIQLLRDFELSDGSMWRWDLNFEDRTSRPNIVNVIKHELIHAIGFIGPEKTQAYSAAFDPPKRLLSGPALIWSSSGIEHHGSWTLTGNRQHFYGPIASTSERNPWRNTIEPGPRLQDNSLQAPHHLMQESGDQLAQWPEPELMMPNISNSMRTTGVARDILADIGYARATRAIRDRRLPRQWYDPERNGHGIDFRRVELADGRMVHFLHFYTYNSDGDPEWYMAVAEMQNNTVFEGGLEYFTYDADRSPPQQPDPSRSGQIRLDMDPPFDHPACADRRELSPEGTDRWLFAVMEWSLPGGDSGTWCMEPITFGDLPAFPVDGSGSWDAPGDPGWGLTVLHRNMGPSPVINTLLYYYDSIGEPTWAWGVAGADGGLPYRSVVEGVEIEKLHFTGFCRTCTPTPPEFQVAGTLRLRLSAPSNHTDGANWVESLDVTNFGPGGGTWQRENTEIILISTPHPNMVQ